MNKQKLKGLKCKQYLGSPRGVDNLHNLVACELENPFSRRRIKANSISEWCRKTGVKKDPNLSKVLSGDIYHFKRWYQPSFLNRELKLKDVYGNNYRLTMRQIVKNGWVHKIGITKLLAGQAIKGLHNANSNLNKYILPKSYSSVKYTLENGGQIRVGNSIRELQKKTGLSYMPIANLIHGITAQSNSGWKLKRIERVQKHAISV